MGQEIKVSLVDGRKIVVNKLSRRPPIYEIKKFLTADECNHLIDLAKVYGLKESRTLDESEDMDTERLMEMRKFDMWDKDQNGNIELAEVHGVCITDILSIKSKWFCLRVNGSPS